MSDDRLDSALEEMKQEAVDAATLDGVRARVWHTLTHTAPAMVDGCAEFRPDLRAYLSGTLTGRRRVLLEDHVSRCTACRTALAEMKGERQVIAMPQRSARPGGGGEPRRRSRARLSVLYLGRDALDVWMAPGGPRATVVSASGGLYRVTGGAIEAGAAIGEKERIRTGPGAHAVCASPTDRRWMSTSDGAVRGRCMERSGHSPPARRRHRPGGEAAPRTPARPDA